jgi:hypothetical protein
MTYNDLRAFLTSLEKKGLLKEKGAFKKGQCRG